MAIIADKSKKNMEDLSTEELHEQIENDKKQAKRSTVFAMTALIAIIILCIAWFVANNRVSGSSSAVSANNSGIELGSEGGAGIHDDVLKNIMGSDGEHGFWYHLPAQLQQFFGTSSSHTAVNWLLNDQSKIGNYSNSQTDWESYWQNHTDNKTRRDEAIEPGSSGTLSFYVVPKQDGDVQFHLNLSVLPYKANDSGYTEVTSENDSVSKNFVDGHFLFFLEKNEEGGKSLQWIEDSNLEMEIADAKKGEKYSYTIYWCWPQNFAEFVLKSGDMYLNESAPLLSGYTNGSDIRCSIVEDMCTYPQKYFYNPLTNQPLQSGQNEVNLIKDISDKSSGEWTETQKEAFVSLSSYYTQADMYLGNEHVDCLRVRLTAE